MEANEQLVHQGREHELPVREKSEATEPSTREGRYYEPAVDIYETEEALVVKADLPGVSAEDVETDIRDNLLTLTATVHPIEARWRQIHGEYGVGHFVRQFRLGQQIDQSRIAATLKEGVLTLNLPKVDAARPRRITVQAG